MKLFGYRKRSLPVTPQDEDRRKRDREIDQILDESGISDFWFWRSRRSWHFSKKDRDGVQMPVDHEIRFVDYEPAVGVTSPDSGSILMRTHLILTHALNFTKDNAPQKRQSQNPSLAPKDFAESLGSIVWGGSNGLPRSRIFDGVSYALNHRPDYVLWYGKKIYSETNLVVVWDSCSAVNWDRRAIALMVPIHKARKESGKNAEIYGIATDSYVWNFEHLDNKGQV
ncbi:hypothetical protein BO71DRAFT_467590 [Aspergillus ellipticus CBS 707.79]|uniref:Uncharacterized protein n=1 Tax=Aspergillus ellipticus CBS 707.79 TaxID=1448320 RepID=A0A319CTI2_9EURO|nr:hypothetical protein BO71DRAFT_467590 [Aspergillus ellipticus CBS 707.79]